MAIIIETDDLKVDQIRASIRQDCKVCRSPQDAHEVLESDGEILVIAGPSISMQQLATLAKQFRSTRPDIGFIAVRDFISEHDMKLALEAGVRNLVPSGDASAMQAAASESERLSRDIQASLGAASGKHLSRMVTVFSPKGGVGKTTVAVNLASALSKLHDTRVCLVDLDLNFGDVSIFFGQKTESHLGLLIGSSGVLNKNAIQSLSTPITSHLDLFLSPSSPKLAEKLDSGRLTELLRSLRQEYNYVVVDTDGTFSNLNLDCFELSDEILLVTTPDLPSIKDLLTGIDLMESLGIARGKRKIVLNRINVGLGLRKSEAEKLLGMKADVSLPESRDAAVSMNKGAPLVATRRLSRFSRAVHALATRIRASLNEASKLSLITEINAPLSVPSQETVTNP